ncbi:peptidyl-prolyl cis-trans isomerase [Niallia sp. Krafla_26]|uniref:peptidyl-prolyl cis-trans isomerase n=1 Tax=Niallia sp. Krafla_26 TaxID=3064703 RepID=UPI003D17BFBD
MKNIVEIKGLVKFKITLDPSVWIFDDRKAELHTFFKEDTIIGHNLDAYTKSISEHWDREIIEGATIPQPVKTKKKSFMKETLLNGTFGIPFEPFLKNAEPLENTKSIIIETFDGEYDFSIEKASDWILCFSHLGKPLSEDGPVHVYFRDGSNMDHPIKNIQGFRIY